MALTTKDLQSIKELVDDSIEQNNEKLMVNIKDLVEFTVEKSETRLEQKIDNVSDELADFRKEMNREISDIAETNHEFLNKLGDHEVRITKLELKTDALKS